MQDPIKNLIGKNRLMEAIQQIRNLPISKKDQKALTQIEGRLSSLNEKIRLGLLGGEQSSIELNRIRNGLLDVMNGLSSTDPLELEKAKKQKQKKLLIASISGGFLFVFLLYFMLKGESCEQRKVAVLVADFQNTERETETDGFANSLVTEVDIALDDNYYDVSPVGYQSRKVRKYDDFIRETHFLSSCDTSGLFVNGFLSMEQEVFNIYMTIVNLGMNSLVFEDKSSIQLSNPPGFEFSIRNDASFLADLIIALLKAHEGDSYTSLEKIMEIEKGDSLNMIKSDKDLKATIAYLKGNSYALRGDNIRANKAYDEVEKYGNPELKSAAKSNRPKAKRINQEMQKDPELRKQLDNNKSQHAKLEKELASFLRKLDGDLRKLDRGVKKFLRGFGK